MKVPGWLVVIYTIEAKNFAFARRIVSNGNAHAVAPGSTSTLGHPIPSTISFSPLIMVSIDGFIFF